jgi:hypothetical protein
VRLDIARPPDEPIGGVLAGKSRRGFGVVNRRNDVLAVHGVCNPLRQSNRRVSFWDLFAGLRQCCFLQCCGAEKGKKCEGQSGLLDPGIFRRSKRQTGSVGLLARPDRETLSDSSKRTGHGIG